VAGGVIRTLVAAASPVVRTSLESLLASSAGITIVAVTSGEPLADDIEAHEPDVVVFAADSADARPSPAAIAAQVALSPDALSRTPTLVLLVEDPTSAWVAEALRAGARSVLAHNAPAAEIVAAVEAAAAGLVTLPPEIAAELVSAGRPSTVTRDLAEHAQPLTPRELEVLGMLAEGLANKNIAARLGISEHTVKTHVASILAKLDAYSRAEAVAIGVRRGLILL
jgi:NarL family two-component system response regulator YdfI